MVLSKVLTTGKHGSFRVFAQIKRGVSDPLAGCTMIRQIIRTRDYENMERAKVAAHTIRLVLAVCSRKTIEPREMAQKYITKCRQIVRTRYVAGPIIWPCGYLGTQTVS